MLESETEVLTLILNCLEDVEDVVRCGVVKKSWLAASKLVQIRSLRLAPFEASDPTPYKAHGLLQQLQRWLSHGNLDSVQKLVVKTADHQTDYANTVQVFVASAVMIAGFCRLQECYLHGHVDFQAAARLLPRTLKKLALCSEPFSVDWDVSQPLKMSCFSRFSQLQSLEICVSNPDGESVQDYLPLFCEIDTACLQHLTSLFVAPCCLRLGVGSSFANHLPMLQHVQAHIVCEDAQGLFDLPSIFSLQLVICKGASNICELVVSEYSSLRQVRVQADTDDDDNVMIPIVYLNIKKKDIQCWCQHVAGVRFPLHTGPSFYNKIW